MARRWRVVEAGLGLALAAGALAGCLGPGPPSVEPVYFEVDVDELDREDYRARAAEAARLLAADDDLHVLIVGHADEDNTDAYNRELSVRRANHVRDLMLATDASLADRVSVQARGEWDPSDTSPTLEAKSRNRRVGFVFYYPRNCEPSPDLDFLACELRRVDLPQPEPAPEPEAEPKPEPEPELEEDPPPPAGYIGPYVFGSVGYGIGSADLLRQYLSWGFGAGYVWAPSSVFRVSVGASFDHLIDEGWVFDESSRCRGYCDEIKRPYVRLLPEARFGAARGRTFAYARVTTGLVVQQEEGARDVVGYAPGGVPMIERGPIERRAGINFGFGPGVAIRLVRGLYLGLDSQLALTSQLGRRALGSWVFDVKGSLGWQF